MARWISFLLVVLLGIGLGLFYGWVISPVTYVDTAPDLLREDFKADYVLMVAEGFGADGNLALAVRRLAILGGTAPEQIVQNSVLEATKLGYSPADIERMQELRGGLLTWNPILEIPTP
jgi:hypothetical protein